MIKDIEEDEVIIARVNWILSGIYVDSLNSWEKEFVESITERIDDGLSLTERQVEKLEEIYREHW